jgi:soluble lytic murein transglycosylase-like protein
MSNSALPHLCALFIAALYATAAFGGKEERSPAVAAYRLSAEESEALRLTKPYVPAPELPKESTTAAIPLADKPFAVQIRNAARNASLDPALVHAVIFVESGYNPAARSPKGAIGLMQVLPATALRYGITNPGKSLEANLVAGTRYLSDLMLQFGNRLELVLAAYNAGENAVLRYGGRIPPYRETQLYVPAVLAKYREWQDPSSIAEITNEGTSDIPGRLYKQYAPGTRLDLSNTQSISGQLE